MGKNLSRKNILRMRAGPPYDRTKWRPRPLIPRGFKAKKHEISIAPSKLLEKSRTESCDTKSSMCVRVCGVHSFTVSCQCHSCSVEPHELLECFQLPTSHLREVLEVGRSGVRRPDGHGGDRSPRPNAGDCLAVRRGIPGRLWW